MAEFYFLVPQNIREHLPTLSKMRIKRLTKRVKLAKKIRRYGESNVLMVDGRGKIYCNMSRWSGGINIFKRRSGVPHGILEALVDLEVLPKKELDFVLNYRRDVLKKKRDAKSATRVLNNLKRHGMKPSDEQKVRLAELEAQFKTHDEFIEELESGVCGSCRQRVEDPVLVRHPEAPNPFCTISCANVWSP